ncbi:hypothetical protein [Actinopolyspora mortivallis]|uniref:hypothetical protein n=1 Tax=Actinopolyspora mortivallis TaxID=33906 RepID=UPI0015E5C162|nr:hypothetical protein [Actinopolyspora mortivallis]
MVLSVCPTLGAELARVRRGGTSTCARGERAELFRQAKKNYQATDEQISTDLGKGVQQ